MSRFGRIAVHGALAALAFAGSAPVARAQDGAATGSRIGGIEPSGAMVWSIVSTSPLKDGDPKTREADQRVRRVANCLATKHRKVSVAYLASSSQSAEHAKIFADFSDKLDDCLSYYTAIYLRFELSMPLVLLRGLVAEALLHQWPRPKLAPKSAFRESYSMPWMVEEPRGRLIEEMALCVAEMHPVEAIDLLATPHSSREQDAAIGKVMAAMPDCLPKDATLKTDAMGIRASIALGVYHRLVDPAQPPAVAAKVS